MKAWGLTLAWLSLLVSALVVVFILKQPTLNNDILALLPKSEPRLQQVEEHFFAANKQQLSFSFRGENAVKAYDNLEQWLASKHIEPRFKLPEISQLAAFYGQYAGHLVSEEYKQAIGDANRFQQYYFSQLSKVADPFVSSTINQDPSLATAGFLSEAMAHMQQFELQDGRININYQGDEYLMLFVQSADNAFSINQSIALSNEIVAYIAELESRYPDTQIRYAGALFHTAANAQQAKFEMTLFGSVSLLALIVMVVWVFRSINALWLASVTVISAAIGGTIALISIFSQVHVLTMVFAVTLIGIAIDYAFHGMLDLTEQPQGFSQGLKLALLLSLLTTTLGYASLFFSPVQLLSQVGVFVVAGLVTAWLCTRILLPYWQAGLTINIAAHQLANMLSGYLKRLTHYRVTLSMLTLVLLSAFALLKPPVINDDVKLLNASPADLMQNEALHMSLLGKDNGQIMILFADNAQQLLVQQEALKATIRGLNGRVLMLSDLVPSKQLQQQNYAQMHSAQQAMSVVSQMTGMPVELSTPMLDLNAALNSPLAPLIANQVISNNTLTASWFMVTGVNKTELMDLTNAYPDLIVYDKVAMISEGLSHYSNSLLVTLAIAMTFALLLFSVKFGFKTACKQTLVLVLTTAAVLLLCSALQSQLSIFNLLGCLLILALAIDYLVFYQVNNLSPSNVLAISLSAASSMWVFGMLAVSKTPAIFSFGLTVLVGLVCIYIFAPLSIALPKNKEK